MKKLFFLFSLMTGSMLANAQVATWADQAACVIYTRCTGCHNPNGIAKNQSFVDYNDAISYAQEIDSFVQHNIMPPWPPDKNYQTYAHEKVLTQEEKDVIHNWVVNGTPQGNMQNAPTPPVYSSTAIITNPDVTAQMQLYQIPPISADLYRCFVIQNVNAVDKFISGLEVIPGNRNIVHHVLVYADQGNTVVNLDNADPAPGYSAFGGIGSNTAELLGVWAPGGEANFFPSGMGIKLMANSHIILQVHYPVGTSGQWDSTKVNLQWSTSGFTREVAIDPILNHGNLNEGFLYIPADSIRKFTCNYFVPLNATILACAPHMHLVGTEIRARGITPANDTLKMIDIPKWDFHWQNMYWFRKPMKVPQGTVLHSEAIYNNTSSNPFNPNSPPQPVYLGEATTDEMMLIYFYWTLYFPGDENIIVDTSTSVASYNGCNFSLGGTENWLQSQFAIFPNPASDMVNINVGWSEVYTITVYDVAGRVVRRKENVIGNETLQLIDVGKGCYFVQLTNNANSFKTKLVLN